jgi:deferrochelatase/peroxidase EfeB
MPDFDDIQGLVFSGYRREPEACYHLVRFEGGAAGPWLSQLLGRLTSSVYEQRGDGPRLNVAFTARGLAALGLAPEALATFPREFLQGMGHPERSRVLGDRGESAPEHWEFGGPATDFDALVLSYATSAEELAAETEALEDDFDRFELEATAERVYWPEDEREHFGFVDARSNPRFWGGPWRSKNSVWFRNRFDPRVPLGEFVLGYRNAYRRIARGPRAPILLGRTRPMPPRTDAGRAVNLGQNGSFLALRKLRQDVAGFRRFTEEEGVRLFPESADQAGARLAAHLVGRWPNGAPLRRGQLHEPEAAELQRFGYRGEEAAGCPVGAHIRRANPRDALGDSPRESLAHVRAHRLIRRGRLYGPRLAPGVSDDGVERGLMFLAIVADLARQFEFVVQSRLDNPKFGGLFQERDPLAGSATGATGDEPERFTLSSDPLPVELDVRRFVRVRGGAYLFLPGLRALAYLAEV